MLDPNTARVRIVNVRPKGNVHLLHPVKDDRQGSVEAEMRAAMKSHCEAGCDIAGYAFVLWDRDGSSTVAYRPGGPVPTALIPEFLKLRLLAGIAERWTIDSINGN